MIGLYRRIGINGVPDQGYDVFIDLPGAYVFYPASDVSLHNSGNPTLNSLLLDPSDLQAGDVSLEQVQDILTVKNTTIGNNGTANYFLNAGTNKVLQDLTLGTTVNGEGNYIMTEGSLSVGGHETLGLAGSGIHISISEAFKHIALGRSPSLGCTPHVTPPHHVTPPPVTLLCQCHPFSGQKPLSGG